MVQYEQKCPRICWTADGPTAATATIFATTHVVATMEAIAAAGPAAAPAAGLTVPGALWQFLARMPFTPGPSPVGPCHFFWLATGRRAHVGCSADSWLGSAGPNSTTTNY